jgi:hypothetical protein
VITAYCPLCKTEYETKENPPYSVMHLVIDGAAVHVHPITREPYAFDTVVS